MSNEPTKSPLRIANPHPQIRFADRIRLQSAIPKAHDIYLFKRILPESGHPTAIVALMMDKFYHECVKRGIGMRVPGDVESAVWDEDNEAKAAAVLADLNFDKPKPKKQK